ncbi:GH92 family glycosyl hydrolase [uncultured Winogradskyella sp.]|uniref:GH92 family glycosyl hydrolase n=1 Tax=uncultured Winogradskyella sp. TaxID=395353 RepID=UPI0035142B92
MRKYLFLVILISILACKEDKTSDSELTNIDYTEFVNPFIGTDGTGHTFPGPSRPFAMVQPGPDNTDQGWDYTSGYQLKDSTIIGFSNTRASGTGISEFGDVLLFPFTKESDSLSAKKTDETADVGYYKVDLNNGVQAELTSTDRVGFHRYTYPSQKAKLLVNLQHGLRFITDSLVLDSDITIEADKKTISGYCHTSNWVERKYFFTLTFDQTYDSIRQLPLGPKENAPKSILDFTLKNNILKAKVALSSVSVDGAKKNLNSELNHWDFEQVRQESKEVWNTYLSKIDIEAEDKQKTIFYTSMYHLFLQPSNIADVDGRYRGADDQIATAKNGEYYSTLSLWDTYRAAHPLYTILVPERVDGFVNTFLAHHKAQGYLPIWTAWGQENHCMIGNHSIPVIVDAYNKGFDGFDYHEAMTAMVESSTENHLNSDWDLYNKYGYYPFDYLDNEAVSRTLESGFDDYAISIMAKDMGMDSIAGVFAKRAKYYENLFDPETGLMRGKDSKGQFRTPFNPLDATSPMNNPGDYTEANAWQYTWTTSHYDVENYTKLLGGKDQFTEQLNTFFSISGDGDNKHLGQEGLIGQYAHGNEPSHHIAYLYAYSNTPERGNELITEIYNKFYDETPEGITGNDDCGQMSAWYIFSTLGFYPVNPANTEYVLGIPQVEKATINLQNGKTFKIRKTKQLEDLSIQLNNKEIERIIKHQDVIGGGTLEFK